MSNLAVFDTNVFVSYFFAPFKIGSITTAVTMIFEDKVIPVYSQKIMAEYEDVLYRAKFGFPHDDVHSFLDLIRDTGRFVSPIPTHVPFIDPSDKPFYDAAVSSGAWLVTGNKKHYPDEPFIVSPREYIERAGL